MGKLTKILENRNADAGKINIPTVRKMLTSNSMMSQLARALPAGYNADRFMRAAMTVASSNPAIYQCTAASFAGALMKCAQLGLDPGAHEMAYIVPHGTVATFILGYKGAVALAHRSGMVKKISSAVVREGDVFNWRLGLNPILEHEPLDFTGEIKFAYSIFWLTNGEVQFKVLPRVQLDKVRALSRSGSNPKGPWCMHHERMCEKTAVNAAASLVPMAAQYVQAVIAEQEESQFVFDGQTVVSEIEGSDGEKFIEIEADQSPAEDQYGISEIPE